MDLLKISALNILCSRQNVIASWGRKNLVGYEPITTFWVDFSIADVHGVEAIQDVFNRAFYGWKSDYKVLTELVLVLNHKMWQHENNDNYCKLYHSLWAIADNYALDTLKGEEVRYFLRVLD